MRGKSVNQENDGVSRDDYVGVGFTDATGPPVPKWSPGAKKVSPAPFMVKGEPARVKSGSSTTHYRQGGMVTRARGRK